MARNVEREGSCPAPSHTCSRKSCAAGERLSGTGGISSVAQILNVATAGFGHAGFPVAISSTTMPSDQMSA